MIRFLRTTKPILVTTVLMTGGVAMAQSTVNLESFSLDDVGSTAVVPKAGETSAFQKCLLDPVSCEGNALKSGAAFSLDDVQNLGVIDRENIATPASTGNTNTTGEAEPLPSIDMEVFFDFSSADIRFDQFTQLNELADVVRGEAFDNFTLLFVGHTDAVGSATANQTLSADRARAVADYVRAAAGLQWDRVSSAGMGFSRLKTPENPFGGQNRRVQLVLVPRG